MAANVFSGLVISAALAVGAGGFTFAGVQFMGADASLIADAASVAPIQLPDIPPPADPELLSAEAFNRPVFHPERTPIDDPGTPAVNVASANVETDKGPTAVDYKLRGVVIGDGPARAGLLQPGSNELVWVKTGQDLEGWTVESVSSDGVRLRSGDEVAEIRIVEKR
jgi:hypothetical protein